MKNALISFVALMLIVSCAKQNPPDNPVDKWNGYGKYLKMGEETHILWAGDGRHRVNVGTVTYGIDDNANFYVTYDCSATGWKISESHMFAGDKKDLPLNRPGSPKISRFPYHKNHNPKVSVYTYRVQLTTLPPAEEPGFVVAAECTVVHPLKCYDQTKTAWAEGDFKFNDKGCGGGWFDVFYFNQPDNQYTILYGTIYNSDTLCFNMINITMGEIIMVYKEYVENAAGTYDAAAYDPASGMFFFVNYNTGELLVNNMNDTIASFSAGFLNGTAASGTFFNNGYYYVDQTLNTINRVTFTNEWLIGSETVLDTIPGSVVVNDIAMDPSGAFLYIAGEVAGGATELIKWEIATDTYYTMSLAINPGAQIAYATDGNLYAVSQMAGGATSSEAFIVNTASGVLTLLEDKIIVDDPFTDLSNGPAM